MIKIIITGTTIIADPAICKAKSVPFLSCKSAKPTDNVYNDSSLATISGHRKLFQPAINVKITWTANIGFDNGRISLKKINISLPPSNRAASIRSSGIVVINWRIKNILKAEIKPGKIIPDRSEEHTSELQSRFDLVC